MQSLFDLPKFGCGIGLHRVHALLNALEINREELSSRSIAIAGSNGKGSTAALLDAIARAHGLRVGLFTSPHFLDIRERFRLNGKNISEEQFLSLEQKILSEIQVYEERHPEDFFGCFEALFCLAILAFQGADCDLFVLEAGIGGRFDPVRMANSPLAAVTSLDLEHTEILGETLLEIGKEKADICESSGEVYFGKVSPTLLQELADHCESHQFKPSFFGRDFFGEVLSQSPEGTEFLLRTAGGRSEIFRIPLLGAHQVSNACLAIKLFERWQERRQEKTDSSTIQQGLSQVRWPGRLEKILSQPLVIIDAGHTPDGVLQAMNGLFASYPKTEWILVTGVSSNKKVQEILEVLVPEFDFILCTQAEKNGYPAEDLLEIAQSISPRKFFRSFSSIDEALPMAIDLALGHDRGIYVAGGMFLASEFAMLLKSQAAAHLPTRLQKAF